MSSSLSSLPYFNESSHAMGVSCLYLMFADARLRGRAQGERASYCEGYWRALCPEAPEKRFGMRLQHFSMAFTGLGGRGLRGGRWVLWRLRLRQRPLLPCVRLGFAHIVHLPNAKHDHHPENAQLQPDAHDASPVCPILT